MQTWCLRVIGAAALALVHAAHAQSGDVSYGFGAEERIIQRAGSVAPHLVTTALERLRTSYVGTSAPTPASTAAPTASASATLAPTAAGVPATLTPPSSGSSVPASTPASTKTGCPNVCTANFKPVCGSDGRTYANACALSVAQCKNPGAKITMATEGECAGATDAPATPVTPPAAPSTAPVTTAPTPATTTSPPPPPPAATTPTPAQTPAATTPAAPKCAKMCTSDYTPICGSDGKTYSNACALSVAQCERPQSKLTKAADGECGSSSSDKGSTPAPPAQTPSSAPVPGSQTLPSSPTPVPVPSTAAGTPTPAATSGRECPQMCTADFKPICGSDGKTYSNACELSVAQCQRPAASIAKVSDGACGSDTSTTPGPTASPTQVPSTPAAGTGDATTTPAPVPLPAPGTTVPGATKPAPPSESKCEMACAKIYAPVCGSNGKTYTNTCLLRLANCKTGSASKVSIKHQGECTATSTNSPTTSSPNTATAAPSGKGSSSSLRGSTSSPFQGQ